MPPTYNLGPCGCCSPDCCAAFSGSGLPDSIAISFSAEASDVPAGYEAGVAAILGDAGYTLTPAFTSSTNYIYPFASRCLGVPGVLVNDCEHPCVGAPFAAVFDNTGNQQTGGFLKLSCTARAYVENGVSKQGARIRLDPNNLFVGSFNSLNFEKYYAQPEWSTVCGTLNASYIKWRVTLNGSAGGAQQVQAELPYKYDDGGGVFASPELYIDLSEEDCASGLVLPPLEVSVAGSVTSSTLLPASSSAELPIKITAQFNLLP